MLRNGMQPLRTLVAGHGHGSWLAAIFASMVVLIGALVVQLVEVTWVVRPGS